MRFNQEAHCTEKKKKYMIDGTGILIIVSFEHPIVQHSQVKSQGFYL